jgi:hypothetical protein
MKLIPMLIILSTIFALTSVKGRIKGECKVICRFLPNLIALNFVVDLLKAKYVPPFIHDYNAIVTPYIDKAQKVHGAPKGIYSICIPDFDKMFDEKEFTKLFIYLYNYRFDYSEFFLKMRFVIKEGFIYWVFNLNVDDVDDLSDDLFFKNIKSFGNMLFRLPVNVPNSLLTLRFIIFVGLHKIKYIEQTGRFLFIYDTTIRVIIDTMRYELDKGVVKQLRMQANIYFTSAVDYYKSGFKEPYIGEMKKASENLDNIIKELLANKAFKDVIVNRMIVPKYHVLMSKKEKAKMITRDPKPLSEYRIHKNYDNK